MLLLLISNFTAHAMEIRGYMRVVNQAIDILDRTSEALEKASVIIFEETKKIILEEDTSPEGCVCCDLGCKGTPVNNRVCSCWIACPTCNLWDTCPCNS